MKRKGLFFATILALLLVSHLGVSPSLAAEEPYKVGAVLEVTGGLSFLGEPGRNTLVMIEEEINKSGGINGHPLEIIIYDTEGQPTRAVTLTQKLIKRDKVSAIVGPMSSGSVLAMIPIIQEARIPNMALGASRKIVEPPKEWVFNTVQTDTNGAARIYEYMRKVGISKVGIITVSTGFGDSGREQLIRLSSDHGIEITADEKFGAKDSDMTAQLTGIQRTDAQAVICWTVGPTEAIVTKNWKQLAMKIPLYQSHGAASKTFLKMTGEAGEGIIFPAPKLIVADQIPGSDPQKAILIRYRDAYESKFGHEVSKFGGNAHDAIWIVIEALKAVGPDRTKIRDYVENLGDYLGVVGKYNYSPTNHNGLTKDYFVMVQVVNGDWKLLE
ncbi:MAG: ABC transporter substrate-binding protein [Proteobacteria bacterium]|nr:ABC transporter substrate-binding protein [Pseudomonadota bacterium]NIS70533.1 ABC transporter substrate-binding protein [Pseudomonadota bacterium]